MSAPWDPGPESAAAQPAIPTSRRPQRARFKRPTTPRQATAAELGNLPVEIKDLLEDLYTVVHLTTDELHLIHWPKLSKKNVLKKLGALYEKGYLERLSLGPTQQTVHVLGNNGILSICHAHGVSSQAIRNRYRDKIRGKVTLTHNLELSRLYALLKSAILHPAIPFSELGCFLREDGAARPITGVELESWTIESGLKLVTEDGRKIAERVPDPENPHYELRVLPDLHFRLYLATGDEETVRAYLWEHERTRRAIARWLEKVRAYWQWQRPQENRYAARFGNPEDPDAFPESYRVIVTAPSWKHAVRLANAIKTLQRNEPQYKGLSGMFLFTRYDTLTPQNFFGKHFLRATDLPLVDLTAITETELLKELQEPEINAKKMSLLDDRPQLGPALTAT